MKVMTAKIDSHRINSNLLNPAVFDFRKDIRFPFITLQIKDTIESFKFDPIENPWG